MDHETVMCQLMDSRGWNELELTVIKQMALLGIDRRTATRFILLALDHEQRRTLSFINSLSASMAVFMGVVKSGKDNFRAFY